MFAIIEACGRQYKVSVGDVIHLDILSSESGEAADQGSPVTFTQVLMLGTPEQSQVGQPYVEGASVKGELVEQGLDKKVIAFKKKRRKGYHKKKGHRRKYSAVVIQEIKAA